MRVFRPLLLLFLVCVFSFPADSQQTSSPANQAASALQSAMAALVGKSVVNDVTLTGNVEWIAGSDDETGTVTYRGLNGAYRLDMTFRNGTRSEIVSPAASGMPSGNWIGLDGGSHAMALHNLLVDAGWAPALTLGNLLSSTVLVLSYVGQETRNGSAVVHISAYEQDAASSTKHLTQVEIYLDPTTFLPASYIYNAHPDNNALIDMPTEIRYSNYQNIAGTLVPLHVQKYVNNTLAIDLQFQNASLNTGITAAQIAAQ